MTRTSIMGIQAAIMDLRQPLSLPLKRSRVITGTKLLESEKLRQQATNNTKEQFANSPDLKSGLLNTIMGALDAHTLMSTQALNSATVQNGMKDILLNHAGLYETLRDKAAI